MSTTLRPIEITNYALDGAPMEIPPGGVCRVGAAHHAYAFYDWPTIHSQFTLEDRAICCCATCAIKEVDSWSMLHALLGTRQFRVCWNCDGFSQGEFNRAV
jgi:hypothetical protein